MYHTLTCNERFAFSSFLCTCAMEVYFEEGQVFQMVFQSFYLERVPQAGCGMWPRSCQRNLSRNVSWHVAWNVALGLAQKKAPKTLKLILKNVFDFEKYS